MSQPNEENNDTPIELSDKQRAFVTAYFERNANGTRAWLKLHPDSSYDAAKSSASEYLTNPNVKAEIKRVWTERAMSAEEAIGRMSAIAQADLFPFIKIDDDGFVYFNFADEQAKEYLFLVKKIKTKRERRIDSYDKTWEGEWVEVELHDAYAALRDIAKMHGKLSERLDLSNSDGSLKPETMSPSEILARADALRKQIKDADEG
jgi:terminase small subunit-like protein